MSSSDNPPSQQPSLVVAASDGLVNLVIQTPTLEDALQDHSNTRPFIMYSRPQLLFLHKSPLVQLPSGMPALKDWFGTENDQLNAKKDSETTLPIGNSRDRRFRRDVDDGGSARQSFRGAAITQPSQMGNFKHQSIRAPDRDRDRDVEKDQDRERLKEGQERLRNLSDKYDRDRRALSSISQIRTKERESAPHPVNSSSRVTAQGHQSVSRGNDSRDGQRKKDGESSEDWRRAGMDQPRAGRDRPENGRKDRDDRERPRSRARDSSRSRRDGSSSRREKEDRRTERDDGHSYRKDKDDRDRDFDRDSEPEDPRRWRDDGKRDERMAARREREARDRERDLRDRRDRAWDGDRSDRRWTAGDDRDSRGKRSSGRDRKPGEDGKDRDDRKDREREKEQPAWMDAYIPSDGSSGAIGGHRPGGELDGIQAFRKEMQQKDKSASPALTGSQAQVSRAPESQLDEIQLFRLMMKREEEKKKSDSSAVLSIVHTSNENFCTVPRVDCSQVGVSTELDSNLSFTPAPPSEVVSHVPSPDEGQVPATTTDVPVIVSTSPQTSPLVLTGQEPELTDRLTPQSSRLLSTTLTSDTFVITKPSMDPVVSTNQVSHPPSGSRLLALGSRNPQNIVAPSVRSLSVSNPTSFVPKNAHVGVNAVTGLNANQPLESSRLSPVADTLRLDPGFSPFEGHREASVAPDAPASETVSRGPLALVGDRTVFPTDHTMATEPGHGGSFANNLTVQPFETVAAAKGSRFAKFFDGKNKDNQTASFAKSTVGASGLAQPVPQKSDIPNLHPSHNSETRAMEDIFAMLNHSAQAQRFGVAPEISNLDIGYGSPSNNLHALQAAQSHPHLLGSSRMDILYDDRNFVPDGMVPGLRSVQPPRSRQNGAMFSDFPDEPIQFNNGQRIPGQTYQGPMPSIHMQHGNLGRNAPISMQAAQFRGAASPNHLASTQRLPPGLANLGGRPPHEPGQFGNTSSGMTNGGLHGTVHGNGPQPPFHFQQSPLAFGGGPQIRVPLPGAHQLQSALGPNALQGLVHPGNLGSSQAHLLGPSGTNSMHGGLRGAGGGFGQQAPQVQAPHIALRQHQQPQQQIPPHMLPLHLQPQSFGSGATNQPTHDLMALLMNGARRD